MNDFNEVGMKQYKRTGQIKIQESMQSLSKDANVFKLTNNASQNKESLSITQTQDIKRTNYLYIQNRLTPIFDIFQIKILTKIDHAFNQIKNAEDVYLSVYSNQKTIQQMMSIFVDKIQAFVSFKKVKNMIIFMTDLKIIYLKSRNQNSKREMLRVNSRIEREYDDFQLLDRNNSNDGNSEKTNKMLLKRKEKNEKQISMFKLQMEQLLSQHENYLKKKN